VGEALAKSLWAARMPSTRSSGLRRHGTGDAYNFPVVREAIGYADALYGFKSGFDRAGKALGVKSGGYWPGNMPTRA
jgi:hypothetical protein